MWRPFVVVVEHKIHEALDRCVVTTETGRYEHDRTGRVWATALNCFELQFSSFQQRPVNFSGGYDLMTAMNVHNDAFVAKTYNNCEGWCGRHRLTQSIVNALRATYANTSIHSCPSHHTLHCTQNVYTNYFIDCTGKSQSFKPSALIGKCARNK